MTEESNWTVVPSGKRGFASMTPERRKEIASKGGKSVKPENRSFASNRDLAAKAGKKGGSKTRPEKRAFHIDRDLASRAGKKGGTKKVEQ